MPGSVRENDADVIEFVKANGIRTILDVGPGRGTYSRILRDYVYHMDALEVWRPYIAKYRLREQYCRVLIGDMRGWERFNYDLVIFGDCMEHVTRDEAIKVWETAAGQAKFGMISTPLVHYPQGALKGNPHEVHVQEDQTPEDIRRDFGPFVLDRVYEITGTFIKEF